MPFQIIEYYAGIILVKVPTNEKRSLIKLCSVFMQGSRLGMTVDRYISQDFVVQFPTYRIGFITPKAETWKKFD